VNKIGGAIQGVDNPLVFRRSACFRTAFLSQDTVVGVDSAETTNDFLLGLDVGFADKVIAAFSINGQLIYALGLPQKNAARAQCSALGDV
jgi:hypothetical protein